MPRNSGAPTPANENQGDHLNTLSVPGPAQPQQSAATGSKQSAALQLVELAEHTYHFGSSPEGTYAVKSGRHVVRLLRGGGNSLRAELAAMYRERNGRIAAQQALADALLAIEGQAQATEPRTVHLRVAESDGAVWIDLGDADEHVVKITADGWTIVASGVPVLFRRTDLTDAMPMPQPGGDLADLWSMLNVSREDQPLVLASAVAALGAPGSPQPILTFTGEQGTGKTVAERTLVKLLDPSPAPLRKPPRDSDAWVTAALGSWVVGLDNLSVIPDWLSDTLCRAVTGDGDVRRQLYTDAGLAVFAFRRVIILNGIDLGGLRGDLTERLITVNLDRIREDQRLGERELMQRWDETYPRLLGALLDQVASMLRILPSVRLETSPRMADFAQIVAALDKINGTDGLARYLDQGKRLAQETLTGEPFIVTVTGTITDFDDTAAALLDEMTHATKTMDEKWRPGRDWPKNARVVTGMLKRYAPALRQAGWTVDASGTNNKDHATKWRLISPETARKSNSPASSSSSNADVASKASKASAEYPQSQGELGADEFAGSAA